MNRLLALALALSLAGSAAAQSSALDPGAEQAALDHLRATAPASGLTPADVSELVVSSGHRSAPSGIRYVYVRQEHGGIDVVDGRATVAVDGRGEVVHAAGRLVVGLASPVSQHRAVLSAEQALAAAAQRVGAVGTPMVAVSGVSGPARATTFGAVAGTDVTARLVYTAQPREGVALAWELQIPTDGARHVWLVRLDAATGAEVSRADLVVSDHFGVATRAAAEPPVRSLAPFVEAPPRWTEAGRTGESYTVYGLPYESPNHAPITPPADGRTLLTDPFDATASPFGWHDTDGVAGAEFTVTWGNNVRAYDDRDDDDTADPGDSPDGGAGLAFTFPLDLTMPPIAYTDAAVVNLFYWNNVVHDVMHHYGFDEAAGNFQAFNYTPSGAGADFVRAEAQDGGDVNNANFFTPIDGAPPRMQMYEWTAPSPDLDGDFDAGVIVHEYTHGTSNRLTGGPLDVACLHNAEQMGEGWSDWVALVFTQQPGDTGPMRRGIGTYVLDEAPSGDGIRPAPYSTDTAENDYTYFATRVLAVPHGVGFVWSTMLWDLTWDLIDLYGYDPDLYAGTGGNNVALALVTEGMKMQPCSPGFVDGRDAILAADAALFPDPATPGFGLHYSLIWEAFAGRGLGLSADQGASTFNGDNLEAFDTPATPGILEIDPLSLSFAVPAGGSDDDGIALINTGGAGDGDVLFEAAITRQDAPTPLTGGPDGFGYTFIDSDEPGGPPTAFEDISGTGTPLGFAPTGGFSPEDEGVADVMIPFPFRYYGVLQPDVRVSTNGFIAFTPYLVDTFTNTGIPSAGGTSGVVAAFWDDLLVGSAGAVFAGMLTDGRFAIQWDEVDQFPSGSSSLTFQIILSPDGTIEIQYETMSALTLTSATVGIENLDGSDGLEVAFDEAYVTSGKALVFDPPLMWASVMPGAGIVPEGDTASLMVSVDATGLPDGVYTADLSITSTDAAAASTLIPITLTVGSGTSILIDGLAGVRLLGPPADGITVDDLAAQGLVRGVSGYRPAIAPNLWTAYDAAASAWVPSAGTGEELTLGHAFRWFLPGDAPGGDVADPFTLTTTLPPNTADVEVTLDTAGDRFNYLGNPFGTTLDLTDIESWPGGHNVIKAVWMYDGATRTWILNPPSAEPWEAFRVMARPPRASARVLTIPASASLSGGSRPSARAAAREVQPGLSFTLDGTDTEGRPLADRSLRVRFADDARAAYDEAEDIGKFQVPAEQYALVGTRAGEAFLGVDVRPFAAAEIPLAVEARGTASRFTLRWDASALPAGLAVALVDLQTGTEVDVRTQSNVTFETSPQAAHAEIPTTDLADGAAARDRFVLRIGEAPLAEAGVTEVTLHPVAPNPSAGGARVAFALPEPGPVRLTVVDVRGREVATLVEGPLGAGRHDARLGDGLAAGVYVIRLEATGAVVTRRAVVVR